MTTTEEVPMPEPRYYVKKEEGSRWAYVMDRLRGQSIAKFDVLKRNGWANADAMRDRLNAEMDAYADARCAKLMAERDSLAERVKALEADARRVFDLYPRHWDLVEGGLFIDETNVAEFDAAFNGLGVRLGLLFDDEHDAAIGGDEA